MYVNRIVASACSYLYHTRVLSQSRCIGNSFQEICRGVGHLYRLFPVAVLHHDVRLCHTNVNAVRPSSALQIKVSESQSELRNFYLGKSVVERMLGEALLKENPETPVSEVVAVVDSVIYMQSRGSDGNNLTQFKDLLMHLGRLYQEYANINELQGLVKEKFPSNLNAAQHKLLLNLFHPKYVLLRILGAEEKTVHIQTYIAESRKEGLIVALSLDGTIVSKGEGINFTCAEKDACRNYILDHYRDKIQDIDLPLEDSIALEEEVHFRDSPKVRKVELFKNEGDNYGFYVRGGDQQEASNMKYRQVFYYTPVYISRIDPGSPAHTSGKLEVGDVILAINDYNIKGLAHKSVVKLINKPQKSVSLTVVANPDVRMKDHLRLRDQERQVERMTSDVTREKWREWHLAQAEKNPEKYIQLIRHLESTRANS